jgi:hypothetical protein
MIAQELALLDPSRFVSLTLAVTHAGGPMGIGPASGWPHLFSFAKARSKEVPPPLFFWSRSIGHWLMIAWPCVQDKLKALLKLNFSKKYAREQDQATDEWQSARYACKLVGVHAPGA